MQRIKIALQAIAKARLPAPYAAHAQLVKDSSDIVLFPVEIAPIAAAAPRRIATFRAGRSCARAALKDLGTPDSAIPVGKSGAPIWPPGFVGSIAHTDEIAAAIVGSSKNVRGLGLDVETDDPFDDPEMVRTICRPEELVAGRDASHPENLARAKLLFAVKESVYKLYHPLTETFLDFHDLTISLDEAANTFRATLTNPSAPSVSGDQPLTGFYANCEGIYLTLAALVEFPAVR